ncbi:aldo/keto reductase [Paenibacillus koleovorans]|uniref:aldo/keto reductase n=1 Tax=Paenibacillus koleovorans TaxID=121608 RepID=UPI000FDA5037|nr:aldo/keto reductase [Paenibacillus koleovorans]
MEKVQINDDLYFSRIILGMMRTKAWGYTANQLLGYIEQSIALGVTTFDHADLYGGYECEAIFGEALRLKPELRQQIQLVTKCGIIFPTPRMPQYTIKAYDHTKEHIIRSVDNSLANLNTDYIDVLLLHRPNPLMDPEVVADAFHTLKEQGKVRAFGVSNFTPAQMNMLSAYTPLVTNQILLSLYSYNHLMDGTLEQALEKKFPIMAYHPVAGGKIHTASDEKAVQLKEALESVSKEMDGNDIDSLMYAWLLALPARIMPIVGSGKIERLKSAVAALDMRLTRDQWFTLYKAARGVDVP